MIKYKNNNGAKKKANLISLPLQNNTNFGIGPDDETQNILNVQPFRPFSIGDEWYLTSAPIITANWEADSDNRWTVPFRGGVGKIIEIDNYR